MSLEPGRVLAHYRLVEPIGEGARGVVWRAHDTSLGRDVAIKVLPQAYSSDTERVARFEREARLLASLQHSNIAAVYGADAVDGVRFIALEYVPGEDLAERLARGPLELSEALAIATQIVNAIEAAHEHGVIHRDLKPANVKLAPDGTVKLLDFGLARALEGDVVAGGDRGLAHSPTITDLHTQPSVILGTASYMSPEQARGRVVDKRADIWAFGALLYELLTRHRMFAGETVSDTLAAVLKTDPDWSRLPAATPPAVRELLRRCLERDPRRRLRDIGEARMLLERASEPAATVPRTGLPLAAVTLWLAAGLAISSIAVLTVGRLGARQPSDPPVRRLRLGGPNAPQKVEVSPNGRLIATGARDTIWLQDLEQLEPRVLATPPSLQGIFWSPDSRWLGCLSADQVRRINVRTGEMQTLCGPGTHPSGYMSAVWGTDGSILFSRGDSTGIWTVPEAGGTPRRYAAIDTMFEQDFHDLCLLPDGRGLLFSAHINRAEIRRLAILRDGRQRILLDDPTFAIAQPRWSPTGHVVYERVGSGVWALPLSSSRLTPAGEPVLLAPSGKQPSLAEDGTLVCLNSRPFGIRRIEWFARDGTPLGEIGPATWMGHIFTVSADGGRIAYSRRSDFGNVADLWLYDAAHRTHQRLTDAPGPEWGPSFSPDGERLIYTASPPGDAAWELRSAVLVRPLNGSRAPDTLIHDSNQGFFLPDGRHALIVQSFAGRSTVMTLALEGDRTARAIFAFRTLNGGLIVPSVSPDSQWVAYASDESGRFEVYVRRLPSGEGPWQVSSDGGFSANWNRDGSRIAYLALSGDVMETEFTGNAGPKIGTPRSLFHAVVRSTPEVVTTGTLRATADFSRFAVMRLMDGDAALPFGLVVQNWASLVRPAKR